MKIEEMQYGQLYNLVPDGVMPPPGSKPTRSVRVETSGGDVVLCNPTYPQMRQFQKTAMVVGGNMGEAYETLFRATCMKFGNYDSVGALIDDWTGVPNSNGVIEAINLLSGQTKGDALKV